MKQPARSINSITIAVNKWTEMDVFMLISFQEMSINSAQVSFSPNQERKVIFSGKTFLFHSAKQLKRMRQAISLAGECDFYTFCMLVL